MCAAPRCCYCPSALLPTCNPRYSVSLQPYVSQVRRASLLLLDQPRGATAVPTAYRGAGLCDWQQQQLEPTLDGKQ